MRIAMVLLGLLGLVITGCELENVAEAPVYVSARTGPAAVAAGVDSDAIEGALKATVSGLGRAIADKPSETTIKMHLTTLCAEEAGGRIPFSASLTAHIPRKEGPAGTEATYLLPASAIIEDGVLDLLIDGIYAAKVPTSLSERKLSFDMLIERTATERATLLRVSIAGWAEPGQVHAAVETFALAATTICTGKTHLAQHAKPAAKPAVVHEEPPVRTAESRTEAYIASKGSQIFHRSTCSSATRITEANLRRYSSREAAIADGKRPCQRCNP